jgi:transcriptional antiterminator NusG
MTLSSNETDHGICNCPWYAVRTKSRHEKVVRDCLAARGFQPLLPLMMKWSQWSDRRKLVHHPLFPGYCFVQLSYDARRAVLEVPGVVCIVGSGRDETLSADEIQALQCLMRSGLESEPHPYLTEGTAVEVIRGPLSGLRGCLIRKKNSIRLVIVVTLLKKAVSVELDSLQVMPVLSAEHEASTNAVLCISQSSTEGGSS